MKPKKRDSNLPKNLTYRKSRKSFYWRNPTTGKEFSLGQIARSDAIAQAIEANNFIVQNFTPVALIEKLKGSDTLTVSQWIDRYVVLIQRRNLSPKTYQTRGKQLATIGKKIGGMRITEVTTRHIAMFLETWVVEGKISTAGAMRSVLSDLFREAIVEGHVTNNPVEPTRTPKAEVQRERLQLGVYVSLRETAEQLPAWFAATMDLALITSQRREDLASMKLTDITDGRLFVNQIKTGMRIAIPLSLTLPSMGLKLSTVIDRCRLISRTDFLISSGARRQSQDGKVYLDTLSKMFAKARDLSGLTFGPNPPTFHEIRSLSGRLFDAEYGKDFAQKILGHTSEKTTQLYLDERDDKQYVML